MYRRCVKALLVVVGCVALLFAAIPFMLFLHVDGPMQTNLMASKLLLMPVGAICLALAAMMKTSGLRH